MNTSFTASIKRQLETMKAHWPLSGQCLLEQAVIGFADMVDSSKISNLVSLSHGFELKQRMFKAAEKRAGESNVTILSQTGDGFLFLADRGEGAAWHHDLLRFFNSLTGDFETIVREFNARYGYRIESGLRFGVARGRVILGSLGSNPVNYTAVGAEVNLASRLCSVAGCNEIVFSESVWASLCERHAVQPLKFQSYSLKGFEGTVIGIHLRGQGPSIEERAAA